MKSSQLRHLFFEYFEQHGHTKVPSSSLIPAQDPTLLFTNAGMNQFKDLFLGTEKRSYQRAVSIQKCVRAGGKHNDLDNVGFTKRHLTFFEMMGNFSFGGYFKKEAIQFAWEFLTEKIKLNKEQLHATVFKDDQEAYELWRDRIGLPENRLHRLGEADNFWQMGDIGPCGPCSEIFIDRGPEFGCKNSNNCSPACGCDRFLEIWNLVFMQFDKQPNGSLDTLKQTGVDTGMGLERLAAVTQNKDSVFAIDLFEPIIKKTEQLTQIRYQDARDDLRAAFHVLADHVRSSTMLIADGCAPSNDGRGYVLRKIIRRAALFAQKLTDKNIFPELSQVVIKEYSEIYPTLTTNKKLIYDVLQSEIDKFAANLLRGQAILQTYLKKSEKNKKITGEQAFKLYDTYGFPQELIHLMAQEHGYSVDVAGFEQFMEQQRKQSGKKESDPLDFIELDEKIVTEFTGYKELATESKITALIDENNQIVTAIPAGKKCWVITAQSPYFIVGGGQVPDQGWIIIKDKKTPLISVRYISGRIAAQIKTPVDLTVGNVITSHVDPVLRTNAMKNHTATHLLQAALIELFGHHIKQAGSLVHPNYLRFDFTYHKNLTADDIKKVEDLVNQKIMANIPVTTKLTTLKNALDNGALAFFGDKYNPENVRMVKVADFSTELCGGTHVPSTGVIGCFKITEVSALSAGHRRIIAVTGPEALSLFQDCFSITKSLSQQFAIKKENIIAAVEKQQDELKVLQKEVKQLKKDMWRAQLPVWEKQITSINNIPFLFVLLNDLANNELREIGAALQDKKPGLYFLLSKQNGRLLFFVTLSPDLIDHLNLKNFGAWLKDEHQLHGGGAKNTLQGSGEKFDPNLNVSIIEWLKKQI